MAVFLSHGPLLKINQLDDEKETFHDACRDLKLSLFLSTFVNVPKTTRLVRVFPILVTFDVGKFVRGGRWHFFSKVIQTQQGQLPAMVSMQTNESRIKDAQTYILLTERCCSCFIV